MDVEYRDKQLDRLETDPSFMAGLPWGVVKSFRDTMEIIRAAPNTMALRNWKSLKFKKLRGKKSHLRSIRLNDQFRLEFEVWEKKGEHLLIIESITWDEH